MHLLSLTGDAEDRGEFPGFDCCWSRPRMWEQYGDVHRGACLLFDRTRLERAIREQWPDEGSTQTRSTTPVRAAPRSSARAERRRNPRPRTADPSGTGLHQCQPRRLLLPQERRLRHGARVPRRARGRRRRLHLHRVLGLVGGRRARRAFPGVAGAQGDKGLLERRRDEAGSNVLGERPPARWSSVARDAKRPLPCAIGIATVLASDAAGLG